MSYKEESNKRYFKKGRDLEDTRCCECGILLAYECGKGEVCYVPPSTQPVYFCFGENNI